jgi:hypothetical protein
MQAKLLFRRSDFAAKMDCPFKRDGLPAKVSTRSTAVSHRAADDITERGDQKKTHLSDP